MVSLQSFGCTNRSLRYSLLSDSHGSRGVPFAFSSLEQSVLGARERAAGDRGKCGSCFLLVLPVNACVCAFLMNAVGALHCANDACVFSSLQHDVERIDPRGRTPLELAVCLGHLESTRVLLRHAADPTYCNAQGWTSEC